MPRTPRLIRHNEPVVALNRIPVAGHTETCHQIVELAREWGWRLLNAGLNELPEDVPVLGGIVFGVPSDPLAQRMREMRLPVAFVNDHAYADHIRVPLVLSDTYAAGALGAEHFAERGFQHLGYIRNSPMGHRRMLCEGFLTRAKELGLTAHLLCLEELRNSAQDPSRPWKILRAQGITEWLVEVPKPLGLLSYHDQIAGSISVDCERAGLAVPEDVAILGFGNDAMACELSPVPLSSIAMEDDVGTKVMHLLRRLIKGEAEPEAPVMLSPKGVVERQSTNVLAIAEPRVARAMRYAWDNLSDPITTEDAARETGVPLSTLRRLFKKHLGRSFNEELRRKRLEFCCQLLSGTDQTVEQITRTVGFRSPSHLYQIFQKKYGISPRTYRNRERQG